MPRVGHFEIHAEDPQKAITFYQAVFDWKFTSWGGPAEYWMICTGPETERGIDGGLMRRQGPAAAPGQGVNAYVCTVIVEAMEPTIEKVTAAGGAIVVPTMPIPGVGWVAYATDTQGNIFGIYKHDPQVQ